MSVFVKNFQNKYFSCNTSRQLLLILWTIFKVPAASFLPYLYVETRGGGRLTISEFYVTSFSS